MIFGVSFDLIVHPLTRGPDRLIHDPAVNHYIFNQTGNDWYTNVAVSTNLYYFYAKLIWLGKYLTDCIEQWRSFLYISFLSIQYFAIAKISEELTGKHVLGITVILLHTITFATIGNPWVYGMFLQIDGGLAPRTISNAIGLIAFYLFMINRERVASSLLGLASLVHVSNTLIVFMMLLVSKIYTLRNSHLTTLKTSFKYSMLNLICYVICGGWFVLVVYFSTENHLPIDKNYVMWLWLYVRAPYLIFTNNTPVAIATPITALLVTSIAIFYLFRKKSHHFSLQTKLLKYVYTVALTSYVSFILYEINAYYFISLTFFKLYTIRLLNYAYFASMLIIGCAIINLAANLHITRFSIVNFFRKNKYNFPIILTVAITMFSISKNSLRFQGLCTKKTEFSMMEYIHNHKISFIGPPKYNQSWLYLNQSITFKSFGFTDASIVEWSRKLSVSERCDIYGEYSYQNFNGKYRAVKFDFDSCYNELDSNQLKVQSKINQVNYVLVKGSRENLGAVVFKDNLHTLYKLEYE